MKIAVLMGGHQSEHEVSIRSGETVISALKPHVESIKSVVIDANLKTWRIDDEPFHPTVALKTLSSFVDVSYVATHGPFGEDGTLQGALEAVDARYTGSGIAASALSMNKAASGGIMKSQGYRVPPFVTFAKNDLDDALEQINELGWPFILKPINAGSSVGVSLIEDEEQLREHVARNPFVELMAQKYIKGVEATSAVIDIGDKPEALPVVEIRLKDSTLFNYEVKYDADLVDEICPSTLPKKVNEEVQQLALDAYRNLYCKGLVRSDFVIDKDNNVWYLETNTSPGLTETSLVNKMLAAADMDLGETLFKMCEKAAIKV